ncbi:uncharacterized protein ARMOST_18617 [Armillaria ostoyae]|uniref:Uncharacterized protein n=1 Tax=Armillaria ostoyae TaxID=47428 RepID=A0A284S296_ARMOS|nr:uncharacterized protein ARMOST_18617 [Armillaria ostoyae]
MTGAPLNWSPCTGCTCPNHNLPPHDFPPNRHTLTPNLAGLTSSNDPPSETEEATLRERIVSCDMEIRKFDTDEAQLTDFIADMKSRISLAEQKVDALRQERQAIRDAITQTKRLLNPVRRLPAEILLRIFHLTTVFPIPHSYSIEGDDEGWNFYPTENMLWTIERVCKQWNKVAVSFPELWSFINVIVTNDNFGDDARGIAYTRRLGLQLDRSKNHLLSLSIWNDVHRSSFTKLPTAIATILFSFSTRVKCLHLYLPADMFASMPSYHFSLPSTIDLCLFPTDVGVIDDYHGLDLFRCPSLRSLRIVDVLCPLHSFHLPWAQIHSFTSESAFYQDEPSGPVPSSAIRLMRSLVNVEECHFHRFGSESFDDDMTGEALPVVCSNLRTLSLSSWGQDNHEPLAQFADMIKLPALMSLQTACCSNYYWRETPETFTAIRNLLERSGPPHITILHFDRGQVLGDDFLHILRTCPSLEDIRLTDVDEGAVSDQTLLQLTLSADGALCVVPRLHTLHLSGNMSFSMQIFVDMVESRWILSHVQSPPVRRLSEVNLCRFHRAEDEKDEDEVERITVLSALDVYKTQGLNVTLTATV